MFFRHFVISSKKLLTKDFSKFSVKQYPDAFAKDGDTGYSRTSSGTILPKDNKVFEAMGAAEELLSFLGLAREYALESEHEYCDKLKRAQTVIIDISEAISKQSGESSVKCTHVKELEDWINQYSKELPVQEKYIIPGSGLASATLHVSRSICRRVERAIVPLVRNGHLCSSCQIYVNRLADFLLTASRLAAKMDKHNETIYVPSTDTKNSQ
ncbi:corrinoid adenosyltransferase MMAB-like isoform X2 [Onthophagus taurus]|uniref:corrinoid adenosyltransferase MMAB-like isoform X2 n=1 Tax=Onthophagus taurus TaxID=166361 RepID=UPI000C1FDAA3|nr:cob(I)yrinic acid a,c-diamide adenosyltransferase, mitochondrial-like isoform X2 [Onthophagus taurus]